MKCISGFMQEPCPVKQSKKLFDTMSTNTQNDMDAEGKSADNIGDADDGIDENDIDTEGCINNNKVITDCSLSKAADLEELNLQLNLNKRNETSDPTVMDRECDFVDKNETIEETSDCEGKLVIETNSEVVDHDQENSSNVSELDNVGTPSSNSALGDDHLKDTDACISHSNLRSHREDLCIPDASSITLPAMTDILDSSNSCDKNSHDTSMMSSSPDDVKLTVEKPKIPYKGTMVPCGKLKDYLDSLPTFNRKCMLRKGREVHKIYVDMTKGETFLDDQFAYTEFGKMVLTNGSIRAGRAKNAKQIVVARETLYCSGTSACKRACGGYGICLPGKFSLFCN